MRSKISTVSNAALPVIEMLEERRLMSATLTLVNPALLPSSDRLIFNRIQHLDSTVPNVVHDTNVLKLENTGDQPLVIGALTVSGPWTLTVNTAGFTKTNLTIPVGGEVDVTLKFTQSSLPAHSTNETNFTTNPNGGAAIFGALTISNTNDPANANKSVTLAGYWQSNSEHNEEPNLTTITNLLAGYDTVISTPTLVDLPNSTTPTYYGQEVISSSWAAANSQPVTIQQLSAFHTQGNVVHTYWYSASTQNSHLLLSSVASQGQTLLPTNSNGTLAKATFSPTGAFGFRVDNEYSNDAINVAANNTSGAGHHFRFYPLIDENGNAVANTFIMAMDYAVIQTENNDYNDNVYIVSNIAPATAPAAPTNLTATNATNPVLTWTAVTYSNLGGYNVYSGSSPTGTFTKLTSSPISATMFTDPNAAPGGQTVYYRVTAVDATTAIESAPATTSANAPGGPVVHNDTFAANAGTATTVNVLANDSDATGTLNPATVQVGTAPTHGTAVVDTTTGAIVYTATAGFSGTDTFTYRVTDSSNTVSSFATVTGTVFDLANSAPVANDETDNTLVNAPLTAIAPTGTDVAGNDVTVTSVSLVTQPTNGNAVVNADGKTVTYTPNHNFVGADSFTYTLVGSANALHSSTATVTLGVGAEISSAKGGNKQISYTDGGGTPVTVKLNKGVADVYFNGTAVYAVTKGKVTITGAHLTVGNIIASGTTAASTLSVTTLHNAGTITIDEISDAGTLGNIVAKNTLISGTIGTPTITVGGLASINIKTATDVDLEVGSGVTKGFTFTAAAVTDSFINSAVPIKSIRVATWSNTQNGNLGITAPSLNTLNSAGNFDPNLNLSGTGTKAPTLGSAKISGQLTVGFWDITGTANSIVANAVANTWGANVSGTLKSLTIKSGGLPADITAGAINSLNVTGNLTGNLTAGATKNIKVSGAINGSTIDITGNLTNLTAGSLTNSIVDVGTTLVPNDVTTVTTANVGASSIGNVKLGAFSNSSIVAFLIKSASLGTVTTNNDTVPEGIAATGYKSLVATFGALTLHAGAAQLTNESTLLAFAASKGFSDTAFGDFQVVYAAAAAG